MRGAWAQMNSNTVMETSREERTIEELRDDEPQVGVINLAVGSLISYTDVKAHSVVPEEDF